MTLPPDPRPLLGEPLPLDLLDTHWIEGGELQDLLATVEGTGIWLRSAALDDELRPRRVDGDLREALCATRAAIAAVAEHPDDASARERFNAVLARGHRAVSLESDGPRSVVVVDDPAWRIGWLAAETYLDLVTRVPDRIRQCTHPQCVLWYLDTSRSGTRRWCSMAICGNRAKAQRHQRNQASG